MKCRRSSDLSWSCSPRIIVCILIISFFSCFSASSYQYADKLEFSYQLQFTTTYICFAYFTSAPTSATSIQSISYTWSEDNPSLQYYLHVDSTDNTLSKVLIDFGPFESAPGKGDGPEYSITIKNIANYPSSKESTVHSYNEASSFYDVDLINEFGYEPYNDSANNRVDTHYLFPIEMSVSSEQANKLPGGSSYSSTVTVYTEGT